MKIRRRKPAIKPGGCSDIIPLTDCCVYPQKVCFEVPLLGPLNLPV